ncbi:MAG TPA: hypothetical protein VK437_05060 [Steroidobacteraceae bacterium]|nr:hypothetical protein [Steroidobacteraceae bacterium]
MSEPKPPGPEDPDGAWLAELAGRERTAHPDPDTRLAEAAGRLIRARFDSALREIRAAPDPQLARARVLAHARSFRRGRRGWLAAAFAGGAGLAAGIVAATLWVQLKGPQPEFGAVTGSEAVSPSPDTKTLDLLEMKRYVIHSRDAQATAAQLAAHLTRAHASLRVETLEDGRVQIDVDPLPSVPEDLSRIASRLGITIKSGESVRFTIQTP